MATYPYLSSDMATEESDVIANRILLVDDDSEVAMLVKQVLELFGYQVTVETDARSVIERVKTTPDGFDLIITDENMPQMQGAQLLKEINALQAKIPVILMSGMGAETNEHNFRHKGFAGFIMKPPAFRDLEALVYNVLNAHAKE
jgi:two-component system, cell cycle sensor histidine kinase and response regulator CckA